MYIKKLMTLFLYMIMIIIPLITGLFRVWVNQDRIQIGYELSRKMKTQQKLLDLQHRLEVELATERSPEFLLKLAEKLNLAPPTPTQIIQIK